MKKSLLITSGLFLTLILLGQQFRYQNPGLGSEERTKDMISRLNLDEKATLMCDISDAIPRLGIKKFNWWSEALHGLANNGNVDLTIPVSNTGNMAGTEIIQVYVHKVNDTDGSLKTLRGFKRIELEVGKPGRVVINLPSASFEFFDRTSGKMAVTAGEYEIWYGNSSSAKDLKMALITIQ